MENNIGLNQNLSKIQSEHLNILLSEYQVFYMNVRGFHWNIKGEKFFELHSKFEELYNNLISKIDEIAERILTLGMHPIHSYSQYLKTASIKEAVNVSDSTSTVTSIVESFKILLKIQREIMHLSNENNDEGTNALMSDYIREQEKMVWMYSAFLK